VKRRLAQLEALAVRGIQSCGGVRIGNFSLLGKGCVGLVVKAQTDDGWAALKIRRIDADRADMSREATLLKLANSQGVGPTLLGSTEDLILMELVEGIPLGRWLQDAGDWRTIGGLLRDCHTLDRMGLDHGELSDASKNVLVGNDGRAEIVDFETASATRRPRNVTSMVHFLAAAGLGQSPADDLLSLLRDYRRRGDEDAFSRLIGYMQAKPELWKRVT